MPNPILTGRQSELSETPRVNCQNFERKRSGDQSNCKEIGTNVRKWTMVMESIVGQDVTWKSQLSKIRKTIAEKEEALNVGKTKTNNKMMNKATSNA